MPMLDSTGSARTTTHSGDKDAATLPMPTYTTSLQTLVYIANWVDESSL